MTGSTCRRLAKFSGVLSVCGCVAVLLAVALTASTAWCQGSDQAQSEPSEVTSVAPNALSRARSVAQAAANGTSAVPSDLPALVDNSTLMYFPPMMRQLVGDCTAYSSTYYYLTFMQAQDEGLNASELDPAYDYPDFDRDGMAAYADRVCSPRFTFVIINAGAYGATGTRTAVERLVVSGAAFASDFAPTEPYDGPWPTETAWVGALNNRTGQLYSIRVDSDAGIEAAKQVLANGSCLVTRGDFGMNISSYHDSASGAGIDNRVMYERKPPPDPDDIPGLTHSICIVGYDDNISYYDADAGKMKTGAFLMADSDAWAWYSPYPWWNWYNSDGPGGVPGTKGFMWLAYDMFKERQLGFYNWPDLDYGDPCHDNEPDPTMYYHDDRPLYRPRLYAVVGINHPDINKVILTGGVGDTPSSPDFLGPEVFKLNDYDTRSISDSTRVAVDLTDGVDLINSGASTHAFVKLSVPDKPGSSGTITSADFFYDYEGNGIYQMISSTDPTVTVTPGNSGYATVEIQPPVPLYVDDSNTTGPWEGTEAYPYQTIQDAIDHAVSGTTIHVLPGTYNEGIEMISGVQVIGSGAPLTTINSLNADEAIYASGVSTSIIEGFTIIAGADYHAIRSTNTTLTLERCVITASKNGCGVDGGGVLALDNCLVAGHVVSGLWQNGPTTDIELTNCTVCDNGSYGVSRWGSGSARITITDTIVTGNGDDIAGDSSGYVVTYSDIGDGDFAGSDGNITADPQFVSGMYHDYYLSQTAAGQCSDSPCVDAGSDTAANLGLDGATTRTDAVPDAGTVDMGYHAWPHPVITAIERAGDDVVITWNGREGVSYVVEWSSDLSAWNEVPVGEVSSWWDTDPGSYAKKFYRVCEDTLDGGEGGSPMSSGSGDGDVALGSSAGSSSGASSSAADAAPGNVRRGVGNVRGR
jgi:hypothetical protein